MPTVKRKTIDKPIKCILPENLNPVTLREQLNTLLKKPVSDVQFWRYLRFIDLVTSDRRKDSEGWVMLWFKVLAKNLTGDYKRIIQDLKTLNIIEVKQNKRGTDSYSADNDESKRYRLTETFKDEETVLVPAYKRVDPKKTEKNIEDKRTKLLLENATTPEYAYLKGNLHKLKYDVAAVEADFEEWLREGVIIKNKKFNEVTREMMRRTVECLNSDTVTFKIGMSNRATSDLTSSYKVLRRRMKVEGYAGVIKQADVSSTQVLLTLPAMREYRNQLTDITAKAELVEFESMLRTREFYDVLTVQLEAEGIVIADPKKDFIKKFCNFNYNHRENAYYTAFKKLYPTVTEFFKELKGDKSFTSIMTPVEAELFNSRIARRVYKELGSQTFLAGIYDAFIFKQEDEERILEIMNQEVYKTTGLSNMVKVATLREESEKHISYPSGVEENKTEVFTREEAKVIPITVTTTTTTSNQTAVDIDDDEFFILTPAQLYAMGKIHSQNREEELYFLA